MAGHNGFYFILVLLPGFSRYIKKNLSHIFSGSFFLTSFLLSFLFLFLGEGLSPELSFQLADGFQ